MAPLLGLAVFLGVLATVAAPVATAATSSNLNFQARLLTNTGAVVPDGNYNIEFKIYTADGVTGSQGSCSGSCVWMESRTVAGGTSVQVINGYFSVNLGSVNAFGAGINWDQQLWLTMRIGGTGGSPTWDAEMQNAGHSIALTALPYAFTAGSLASGTGSSRGTLSFASLGQATAITLPDPGAGTATICYQNATACGFAPGTNNSFIQNQIASAQTANFNIQSAASGSIGAIIQGASSQSVDIFEVKANGVSTPLFSVGSNGSVLVQTPGSDSTTALQIQDHTGTSNLLVADTTVNRIGIGKAPTAGYQLDVAGSIGSQSRFVINSSATTGGTLTKKTTIGTGGVTANDVVVLNSSGQAVDTTTARDIRVYGVSLTTTAATSTAEIALSGNITVNADTAAISIGDQLVTSTTSGRVTKDNNATTGILGVALTSKSGGSNGTVDVALGQVRGQYNPVFRTNSDNAAAFQVQNASNGQAVMTVDTTNNQLLLGTTGTSGLNGKLVFSTTNASNTTITIQAASTATSYSLTLPSTGPSLGQCLQNDGTTVGQLTFGPCGATGTFLSKVTTDTASAAAGSGFLYTFTNSSSASTGGVLNLNNGNNTGSTLSATTSGNPASGKAVIYGENTNASPSGNLLDLRSGSTPTSKFSVDSSGNVTASGTYNTNTFTGSSLVFGSAATASVQSASSQALNFTSNATSIWQVAGTNQNLTIQTSGTGTLALDTVGGGTVNLGASNAATINIGSNSTTALTIGGVSLNGTVTTKALGILRTLTGSSSAPSDILKTTTNSASAFQVQNSSSQSVFGVDTSGNKAVLGQANALNGALIFQNSGNSNGITLNTTGGSSAYTLTLPSAAPAGGLCIETQPGNASQLIFASCTNNNASIQEVAYWDANSTNTITSVTPTTIGDEMVLTTQIPNAGVTVSSISGGGVASGGWTKVVANNGNGTVNRVEMWVGTVSSLTTTNIVVTYTGGTASGEEVTATEFTAAGVNASTSWGVESSGSQLNTTASTTVTFPSATAVNGSELYVGYAQVSSPPATSGVSSGFSYIQTSTQHNMITYNTSLAANTAYQPTANQNSSGQSNTVEAVLTAFVTSSSINNTTSLQKANFYVQAASAGSVAGVLQAASSGSADIMDLRNSSGNNVFSVGSTGDVLVKPAASATAFQVQNGSGYSVLGVDTSGSQVTLGDATHLSGKITFKDSSDTNTISIQAPSSVAATYTLSLPTNTPTAGLCLGTSPSNANQLIFASCATQVSAASITYINQWSNSGTNITTLADSPASVGNLLVLFTHSTNNVSIPGGGVAGGGVTNWTKVTSNVGAAGMGNDEMWRGVVTTTGSSTITISSYSGAGVDEITAQEYTMGGTGGGTWAIDTSGTNTGTSTTINYPSLTPANSSELYAGYAWSANTPTPSGTSGYTYTATNSGKYTVRNTSVTGGVATQPQSTQTSGNFNSIAAAIQAFAGTSVIVNSTATQQANFNVQAALSGTVAGVLQGAASGSADVLQVKDGSGNNVMAVNGTSGVTLGTSTVAAGTLVFNAAGNSNTITITAPLTPGTSYTLKLPSAAAAPGQCLAASPSDFQQLVFSSCANQVTSVAISFVNNWKNSGSSISTLNISPANLNDIIVVFSSPRNGVSTTGISGCSITWSKVSGSTAGSGADTSAIDMYKGVVNATGACTLTATFSGSQGNPNEIAAMEFTTGSSTGSWVVDASNAQYNGTANTTAAFPSLTPQSSRDLYVGYGAGGTFSGTVSSGYTYVAGNLTNRAGIYNTNVNAATSPTATQTSSASITVGALIAAYSSSSVISNSTVTQQANFNIQAATSGSVAGVLQAFPTGTGDILELLDGSGTLTDKFDYQGNLLVRPSTAGATAFQVQTTGSVNVLSVDTNNLRVVIGAGSAGEATPSLLVLDNQTGSSADPGGVNGAMYYNATNHTFRCYEAGAWQNCGGLLSSNTSQSSANNNCSNNCGAFSTFASVPANYCQAGRVIKLNAHGYFSSQVSATNLQFGVYYGTDNSVASNDTLIGTLTPTVSVTSASNNYFGLDFDVTCFSTTSMQADGLANIQVGAAASGVIGVPISSTSPTTVVSTSAKNLYIFPIWGAASTSNTAKITQFIVTAP
jgi:hypothetical protein